ncbi:hypothetical protein MGH68_06770 [Erysipelothrix sp. D19-032]
MIDLVGDDEGAFSPERSGGLPLRPFMDLCYNKPKESVTKDIRHRGGLVSYFDTNDVRDVEALIDAGNTEAKTHSRSNGISDCEECWNTSSSFIGRH